MREITIVLMPMHDDEAKLREQLRRSDAKYERAVQSARDAVKQAVAAADPYPPKGKDHRQNVAAPRIGLHQSQLSNILKKGQVPSLKVLIRVADYLGRGLDEVCAMPVVFDPTDIESLVSRLDVDTAARLYDRLREYFERGSDEMQRARVVTTPSVPPTPELTAGSDTAPEPDTKKKRPRRRSR